MYSYARSASILSKAGAELNMKPAAPEEMDRRKAEYTLLRHIAAWQDTLYEA